MEYFIEPKKALTYFSNNFKLHKSTNGWQAFKCPFCNELHNREKMTVKLSWMRVKCWVCGYAGSVLDFVMDFEGAKVRDAVALIRACKDGVLILDDDNKKNLLFSDIGLPSGYTSIMEGDGILGIRARTYLVERGFDLREMDRLGLGYCLRDKLCLDQDADNYFGYIIIPFKERGKLVYFIARDYIGNFLRYKNPPTEKFNVGKADIIFNNDALDLYDEVFILEGWADACTMGRQGTSTQGWSLSRRQKSRYLSSQCKRFIFVPDAGADDTGVTFYEKAVEVAMDFLDLKDVFVLDLNKLPGAKDANQLGKSKILELYAQTEKLTYSAGTEILIDYVYEVPENA